MKKEIKRSKIRNIVLDKMALMTKNTKQLILNILGIIGIILGLIALGLLVYKIITGL